MTTRLKLVCHASTSAVRTSAFPADEPLDPQGRKKLAAASHDLGHADRRWTSPALRARETAAGLGLEARAEPMLRDCDYGRWTGRAFEDVQAHEPDGIAEWLRDPGAAPHGGESVADLMTRIAGWLDTQISLSGQVVAITHASVIRAAVVYAIEATPRSFWRIDIAPLSVTTLSGNRNRWSLVSIAPMQGGGP